VSSTLEDSSLAVRSPSTTRGEDDETTLEFVAPGGSTPTAAEAGTSKYTVGSACVGSAVSSSSSIVPDDERIRCVCLIYEVTPESGRMLRCGRCKSWQHSSCFILPEDEDDESYLCYICSHPPGIRDSKRRLEEVEEYLTSGDLARFPTPKVSVTSGTTTMTTTMTTSRTSTPETRPPITYVKQDVPTKSSPGSLDTLAAVNLRGRDTQAGFFKAVGMTVNNVCAGVHRLNDCLHGTELRMHRLKTMLNSENEDDKTSSHVGNRASTDGGGIGVGQPPSDVSSQDFAAAAAESARINAEHDALEARLAAMEAEMDEVERLWDASEEFVSLPPAKKPSEEAPGAKAGSSEVENQFRIKRALKGLIEDLNQVQQITFIQSAKQK